MAQLERQGADIQCEVEEELNAIAHLSDHLVAISDRLQEL
jgi:hypothetical protein